MMTKVMLRWSVVRVGCARGSVYPQKTLSTSMTLLSSRVPRAASHAGSKGALIACGAASGIAAGSFGPIADAPEEVAFCCLVAENVAFRLAM